MSLKHGKSHAARRVDAMHASQQTALIMLGSGTLPTLVAGHQYIMCFRVSYRIKRTNILIDKFSYMQHCLMNGQREGYSYKFPYEHRFSANLTVIAAMSWITRV